MPRSPNTWKDQLEAFTLVFGVVAALVAGGWALFRYFEDEGKARLHFSSAQYQTYVSEFGGLSDQLPRLFDSQLILARVLPVQCAFLVAEALIPTPSAGCERMTTAELGQMAEVTKTLTDAQEASLRDRLEAEQAAYSWTPEEEGAMEKLLRFYRVVTDCVEMETCDPRWTFSNFEREIVPFLNATCGKLAKSAIAKADAIAIAEAIRRLYGAAPPYWSTDKGRSQQFMCNWLRVPEPT